MPQLIGGPGTDAEMVARIHSVIEFNPLERLKLAKILPRETLSTDYAPDPYTAADLEAALVCMKGVERNAFQFWAFMGLRTSELIAQSWTDYDLVARTARVHRAVVEGEEKTTKTKAGIRVIPMLLAASQAIEAQRRHTEQARVPEPTNRRGMDRSVAAASVAADMPTGQDRLPEPVPDAAHLRKQPVEPGREPGVHRQATGPQNDRDGDAPLRPLGRARRGPGLRPPAGALWSGVPARPAGHHGRPASQRKIRVRNE